MNKSRQLKYKIIELEAEVKRCNDLLKRWSEQHIITQRTLNMAIERVKELGGLNHAEIEEFYRERAKREYKYYQKHGENPKNFDEVIIDESAEKEEVKPMHVMLDELDQALPRVQSAILRVGIPGSGKSSIVRMFCKKRGIKCKNVRVSKASAKEFLGHATKSPRR